MKLIISIIISIVISVFVLGALTVSGVMTIGKSEESVGLTITFPIPGKNGNIVDKIPDVDTDYEEGNVITEARNINSTALMFLKNLEIKGNKDIEEQFTQVLIQEHNADRKTVDLMMRKCFWKNFCTLQAPLDSFNDLKSFETEYLMEKKLKTAGFMAMNLTLMEGKLDKADSRFKLLQEKMTMGIKGKTVL